MLARRAVVSTLSAAVLLPGLATGCGGATKAPPTTATAPGRLDDRRLSALCDEPEAAVEARIKTALAVLRRHGLHYSEAVLTHDLYRAAGYASEREAHPPCGRLLAEMVATFDERPERPSASSRRQGPWFTNSL